MGRCALLAFEKYFQGQQENNGFKAPQLSNREKGEPNLIRRLGIVHQWCRVSVPTTYLPALGA